MNTGVKRRNKRATTDALLPVVGGWGGGQEGHGGRDTAQGAGLPRPLSGKGLGGGGVLSIRIKLHFTSLPLTPAQAFRTPTVPV